MHQAKVWFAIGEVAAFLVLIGGCSTQSLPTDPCNRLIRYEFVQAWSDSGSGDGQFFYPQGNDTLRTFGRGPVRLGLLADIHEAVERLASAVQELNTRRVDAFIMLGDVLDNGERADETISLLTSLPGAGVWGNHDFGLCGEVEASARVRFSARTLDYFATLSPWIVLEGCRFQHFDPHLDPEEFENLWSFPTTEVELTRQPQVITAPLTTNRHCRPRPEEVARWAKDRAPRIG